MKFFASTLALLCLSFVLSSCGTTQIPQTTEAALLDEVASKTGYVFDTLQTLSARGDLKTLGEDRITTDTYYTRSDEFDENTAALSVFEFENGDIAWVVNAWQGNALVRIDNSGETTVVENARNLEIDEESTSTDETSEISALGHPVPPQPHPSGCKVCTEWKTVPGHYKEHWVTTAVRNVLSFASGAACQSAGGIWAGGVCYTIVYQVTKVLEWVPGYTICYTTVIKSPCPSPRLPAPATYTQVNRKE